MCTARLGGVQRPGAHVIFTGKHTPQGNAFLLPVGDVDEKIIPGSPTACDVRRMIKKDLRERTAQEERMHNAGCTCWNCPAMDQAGKVDLHPSGQSVKESGKEPGSSQETRIMAECSRRPELGLFDPMGITFAGCPEWKETPHGYVLKDMRVMILGIDGYLGWTLALWLGDLGCDVSGVDNHSRRGWLKERGADTVVPISCMNERLHAANEILGITIDFREIDILDERDRLKEFIEEVKPEAIVHYGECPSAPYSMIDADHAIQVQKNNVLGTLGLLFIMRDVVPQTSLLKLGTMGEYGTPNIDTKGSFQFGMDFGRGVVKGHHKEAPLKRPRYAKP